MRFLVDAQLPRALIDWIFEQGHDAEHVHGLGLGDAPDEQIWQAALDRNLVIVTKDRDFADWTVTRRPAASVVWIRFGNVTNTTLVGRLTPIWQDLVDALDSGARVVEAGR